MKKTFISIVLMSAFFTVVSCSKSFDPSEKGTSSTKVFTATIEEGTKTSLEVSTNKVLWVVNDMINIKDINNNCAIYKATTGGTTTTTFQYVSGEESLTVPFTAYYPSSLLVGTTPTLPATQTYDATNPFSIYPMYASSNDLNLNFKNICGVLAITIQGINVKTINVSSSNKALSGSFIVDANYNAVLTNPNNASNSVTLDCGSGVSTDDAKVFYIPIPAQTYKDIRIIVNNASYMVTTKSSIEIKRNTIYSFTYSGTNIPTPSTLNGEFSVSATKKVKFSKGNLQASIDVSGNPTGWKLATNQYDYIGNSVANTSIGTASGNIDLFGWSTDVGTKPWGINTSKEASDYEGNFVDWGTNPSLISALGSGWRTLSSDEWEYLLGIVNLSRDNASSLYKYGVKVCGKPDCLIIAPDGFAGSIADEYNESEWATAEAQGLVCLPPAGCRYDSNVADVLTYGYYWSSADNGAWFANNICFGNDFAMVDYNSRVNGYSVRLVR